jgi:archaellum component FlaC
MASCAKCSIPIGNAKDAVISCAECGLVFHPTCTRIETVENFKKFSVQRKASWKCDGCSTPTRSDVDCSALASMLQKMDKKLCAEIGKVNSNLAGVKTELEGVNSTVAQMQSTLSMLVQENEKRKEEYIELAKTNEDLKHEVGDLRVRVRDLEQYSRRNNVEIVGVPYSADEDVYDLLEQIATLINIRYQRREISTAHRLRVSKERPNPSIIVSFVCRDYKHLWISAAREHRKSLICSSLDNTWPANPIYVNDHLTPNNRAVLSRAKRLVRERKLFRVWTRDCRVYVRKTSDEHCRPMQVNSMEELDTLLRL